MRIRSYRPSDLDTLYDINQAGVPGVGDETKNSLETWINLSTIFIAADTEDTPTGFITLIEPGTLAYDSSNLRWFEAYMAENRRSLIYVDRIAIAQHVRGQLIGEQLYKAAFEAFAGRDEIGCEININPPNPGSMRFHTRLGYKRIGDKAYGTQGYHVAYYVRTLASA